MHQVMIVDDDPRILLTVRTLLTVEGFPVVTADSGEACLRHLEEGFSGLVLMDIMMPGLDGWDTIRACEARGYLERILIVMLTARDVPDAKMEGLQELVFDYITKPFHPDEFVAQVRRYVEYL
jgi:DNA-binding response OmpR family regulator